MRAVQRSFPQVYHSIKPIDNSADLDASQVKVTAADFEHALLFMNPSTKRHSSRNDLVAHQKPQLHLYAAQLASLLGSVIRPRIRRAFAQDSSGKASWQVTEPLVLRLTYCPQAHPDAFVWRFMCGAAESLDGFAVEPVDLAAELSANANESVEGAVWRVLTGLRGKGPVCVLFRPFYALGRGAAKSVRSALQQFAKSLLPGEPIVILYMLQTKRKERGKEKEKPSIQTAITKLSYIETFHLFEPDCAQVAEYCRTVLQTLYRMLAADFAVPMDESAFVQAALERLASSSSAAAASVLELERLRMDWTDRLLTDARSFFQVATGMDRVIEAHASMPSPEESDGDDDCGPVAVAENVKVVTRVVDADDGDDADNDADNDSDNDNDNEEVTSSSQAEDNEPQSSLQ